MAVTAGRLVLAAIFVVAGLAKLVDRRGSTNAMSGFGVPRALAPATALLLSGLELALAAALLWPPFVRWGAAGAVALLVVFVAVIGFNVSKGTRPDCHCFGQLHSAPAGWSTLARNAVLAGLAGYVAVAGWNDPGPSATAWLGRLSGGQIAVLVTGVVLCGLVGVLTSFLLRLLPKHGRLILRVEALEAEARHGQVASSRLAAPASAGYGLPPGSKAPPFAVPTGTNGIMTLDGLLARGTPALLVFSSDGCTPCTDLMPDVARWERDHAGELTVAVVTDPDAAKTYEYPGTPSAVLVASDGSIAAPLAAGSNPIRELVAALAAVTARGRENEGLETEMEQELAHG